jgi:hypothetical protein
VYKNYFEKVVEYTLETDIDKYIPNYFLSYLNISSMFNVYFYIYLSKSLKSDKDIENNDFVKIVISDTMENIKSCHSVFLCNDLDKYKNEPTEVDTFYYDAMRLADYYCFSTEFLEYFIFSMTYKLRNKKNYTEDIKMFPSFGPELLLKQSWEYFKIL